MVQGVGGYQPVVGGVVARSFAAVPSILPAPVDESGIAELQRSIRARNAAVADALRGGELVQDGVLGSSGITGPPALVHVDDPVLGKVRALSKSASGNFPIAEEFAEQLAERLGIGHLLAPTVERDGRVVVALVEGVQARQAGVRTAADLERMLRRFYAQQLPDAPVHAIANQARIDRQLFQVFDHALAVADRHGRNVLVDSERGASTLIDHSELLLGHRSGDPLQPRMLRSFMAGPSAWAPHQSVQLDDDVRRLVAERVPPTWIDDMLAQLRARPDFSAGTAGRLADDQLASTIAMRLEHAATTGELRYRFSPVFDFACEQVGNLLDDSRLLRSIVGFFRR